MNTVFARRASLVLRTGPVASRQGSVTSQSTVRLFSTRHGNDPKVLEKEKQRNLAKESHDGGMDHAPGWNEHLASESEAHIKADKHEGSTADMQDKTLKHLQSRHGDGSEGDSSAGTA